MVHQARSVTSGSTSGGAVPNPAHLVAGLVARLHGADGRVTVPGFYDDVRPLTEAERLAGPNVIRGGERGGQQIPGFDLGNSPAEYARDVSRRLVPGVY